MFVIVWFAFPVRGQLSDGGEPLAIPVTLSLKSKAVVALPKLDNGLLQKASLAKSNEKHLKPFRFAEPIAVSLSTENSGRWVEVDGYRVWQLVVVSEGAKSLNLIFDGYQLPVGSRLFLFSDDRSDIIGAFTSKNNDPSGVFATSPVVGDRLVVQYEEPIDADFAAKLSIKQVSHDFVGIKSLRSERRPLGISGSCNVNINCETMAVYSNEKNGTCRIITEGTKVCTGALVNNTNEDGTPYVYTAGHCINTNKKAVESVFLFNYESPYCGDIDGDASHSLSGSVIRANSDSLDFSLVELSEIPPPNYRPYYMGWDRGTNLPDSSACIHHPLGDVKKIAIDRHSPKVKSYSSNFIKNAFLYIGNWEEGTTEGGSSGAPLINHNKQVVGSLTGGAATCEDPSLDYFAMLGMAWNYYPQANMQLKPWLDPKGSNAQSLNGFIPYSESDLCGAFTNMRDEDSHENLEMTEQGVFKGYWSGNNVYGFSAFAEKFEKSRSSEVMGVSFGVAKASLGRVNSTGKVKIAVYEGEETPDKLLYSQDFDLKSIDEGVMNYLEFVQPIETSSTFFIGYSLELLEPADTFSVFLAKRDVDPLNSFFIQDGQEWYTFQEKMGGPEGSALVMEAILCNVDSLEPAPKIKNNQLEYEVFPNPVRGGERLLVKFHEPVLAESVRAFDLLGRQINVQWEQAGEQWLSIDFSGQIPGNYFLKVVDSKRKRYHMRAVYLGD
jgi:V8-like Glu-specific endopeptidase